MRRILALLALSAAAVFAQTPAITAVQDGAAYTADIPQGAVFVVKGTNLSAAGYAEATAPSYPATLNSVQINLTAVSGGTVVTALMVYTYNQGGVNQLAAVLPSTTAIGAYDLRVTNGANTSAPFRMNVAARKPGIVTADGSGSGEAQATLSGGLILARRSNQGKIGQFDTRPARPGERVDLWGTGVGADVAADTGGTSGDQTAAGTIRVVVNGTDVTPLYAGRSQGFPGLDQVVFTMPSNVTPSCAVTVQVRAGGVLSNLVSIAVSTTDTCPTTDGSGGSSTNPTQAEIDSWIARGSYVSGTINLNRSTTYGVNAAGAATVTKADSIGGQFTRFSGADLGNVLRNVLPPGFPILAPAVGSCVVYNVASLTNPYPNLISANLDAGPQLTSSGPNGTQPVPRQTNQIAGPTYNTGTTLPNTYLAPGPYTLSGPGGTAVGPFTGSMTLLPELVVTNNPEELKSIARGAGVTVRWTGGDSTTVLTVSGQSIDQSGSGAAFVCIQNVSAGQFTVPASVLNLLPASPAIGAGGTSIVIRGTFIVTARGAGARFSAPTGVDILTGQNSWMWLYSTQYQ
jgi:uncharacterized protein (TIGR03437 family)